MMDIHAIAALVDGAALIRLNNDMNGCYDVLSGAGRT